MGMGLHNPGCTCCLCTAWTGDIPDQVQLTLPAECTSAGTYLLSRLDSYRYDLDCPGGALEINLTRCAAWHLKTGTDDISVTVIKTSTGRTYLVAAICEAGGCGFVDGGTVWATYPSDIIDWSQLDGYSVPFFSNGSCNAGTSFCSNPSSDAVISFPP